MNHTRIERLATGVMGAFLLFSLVGSGRAQAPARSFELLEATIPDLPAALVAGSVTSRDPVRMYLARIDAYDQKGPALNAISAITSQALAEADALDAERKTRRLRGPLHGIPILIKDNYETVTMTTANGSRSLAGWIAGTDAVLVKKLRDAGAIVLDAIGGSDPTDPQTATSVGHIPKSYTDFLQLGGLRGARIGALTNLFGTDPADTEIATVVRSAINQMRGHDAEVVDVTIPGLNELLMDRLNGFLILTQDFKFDFNASLASRPTAPVRTLEEVLASGKYHPSLETGLRNSQAVASRDTKEYLEHIAKRDTLRHAILEAMADHRLDALAYPTIRRKANVAGQPQAGTNCHLSANSGLPAIVVPGGFRRRVIADRRPVRRLSRVHEGAASA